MNTTRLRRKSLIPIPPFAFYLGKPLVGSGHLAFSVPSNDPDSIPLRSLTHFSHDDRADEQMNPRNPKGGETHERQR